MNILTVIGIDVGGDKKGFHAIALRDGKFDGQIARRDPDDVVQWCLDQTAEVVAVDAPCRWSQTGKSRLAERELKIEGEKIHCFATPRRADAIGRRFYLWVFNGEKLYQRLQVDYQLFDGQHRDRQICIETFPHAVVCSLAGRVVSAKPKGHVRRKALQDLGYDVRSLPNIDFVDAALCAVTAEAFRKGKYHAFGDSTEGFIVVPLPY